MSMLFKPALILLANVGLLFTGLGIYLSSQQAPQFQYYVAFIYIVHYCIGYTLLAALYCRFYLKLNFWTVFWTEFHRMNVVRAFFIGFLWAINIVLITIPSAFLSNLYQTLGATTSFLSVFLFEYVIMGSRFNTNQKLSILLTVCFTMILNMNDSSGTDGTYFVYWFVCLIFNQVAANLAQLLLELHWKFAIMKNDRDLNGYFTTNATHSLPSLKLLQVLLANSITNWTTLPFLFVMYPFKMQADALLSHNNSSLAAFLSSSDYIWYPLLGATGATVMTIGTNWLLLMEDFSYSTMTSNVANVVELMVTTTTLVGKYRNPLTSFELSYYISIILCCLNYATTPSRQNLANSLVIPKGTFTTTRRLKGRNYNGDDDNDKQTPYQHLPTYGVITHPEEDQRDQIRDVLDENDLLIINDRSVQKTQIFYRELLIYILFGIVFFFLFGLSFLYH